MLVPLSKVSCLLVFKSFKAWAVIYSLSVTVFSNLPKASSNVSPGSSSELSVAGAY